MDKTLVYLVCAILLVDLITFLRGWSMKEWSVKRILIFILLTDLGIMATAGFIWFMANFTKIVGMLYKPGP